MEEHGSDVVTVPSQSHLLPVCLVVEDVQVLIVSSTHYHRLGVVEARTPDAGVADLALVIDYVEAVHHRADSVVPDLQVSFVGAHQDPALVGVERQALHFVGLYLELYFH